MRYMLVAVAVGLIGCGGSSHKSEPDMGMHEDLATGDMPGVTTPCEALAAALCTEQARCNATVPETKYIDGDCVARRITSCMNSLTAPGTATTNQTISACAAGYAGFDCTQYSNGFVPTACSPPAGSGAIGTACNYSAQCSTAFCAIAPWSSCGTCETSTNVGDPCKNGICSPGLYCSRTTQTCKTHGAIGDSCDSDDTCGYRLSCVGSTASSPGTCLQMVAEAGLPCLRPRPTPSPSPDPQMANCDLTLGLFCVGYPAATRVCVPTSYATLLPSGTPTPCGAMPSPSPTTAFALCTAGSQCVYSNVNQQVGTCVGPAADGASCDTSMDDACEQPAKCVGNPVDGGVNGSTTGGVVGTCVFPGSKLCH